MKKMLLLVVFTGLTCIAFAQNHAPVGVIDSVEVMSQVPAIFDVKLNDYDPDGDEFSIYDVDPHFGAFVYVQDDKLWFRSKALEYNIIIRYRLQDSEGKVSAKTMVHVRILPNPDAPVSVDDTINVTQLIPQQLNILSNDIDPNGDLLKMNSLYNFSNCSVNINPDSLSVTVTPDLGSYYSFRYDVVEKNTPAKLVSFQSRVSGDVSFNPDIPIILPDELTATGGITSEVDVLANDYDVQDDLFEVANFSQPLNGTVDLLDGKIFYTPFLSYTGSDSFSYNVREVDQPDIYSSQTTVSATVLKNPNCPIAVQDEAEGITGIEMTIEVLENDYDINGDLFTLLEVQGGTITADKKIKYKSSNLQFDTDTIFYRICEIGNPNSYSEWTSVYISLDVNPALPIAVNDTIYARGGIPVSLLPLANDIQNDSDTMIMTPIAGHWGKVFAVSDTLHYIPAYQANGIDHLGYFIRNSNAQILAIGSIIVICESKFYDSLQISNINAGVHGGSFMFSKHCEMPGSGLGLVTPPGWEDNFKAHFEFPKGSHKHTIFNSTIWNGGMDSQNALHFAGERYKQGQNLAGGTDYQPGPIATEYNTEYLMRYLRIWKVSREEVENHMNNFWRQDYTIPEAILNWPGNGNIANGEAQILAPYFDLNADGIYNSHDGDYPLIRGDQTIFLMFNDDREHTESSGTQIRIEIHAMVYGFNTPEDTALYNSVFVHYDLINRSNTTYTNFYTGIFTDTDLGDATDDYIASNVQDGSFYTYNGKPADGDGQYWAYGENPPAQSVTILAGPYKDEDGIDNDSQDCSESINGLNYGNGIIDDERLGLSSFVYFNNSGALGAYMSDPEIASEYYNYMQAKWLDGTQMQLGGNGHSSTGAVGPACKYMYPGDSDPDNWGTDCVQPNDGFNTNGKYWTEESAMNMYNDRRGFGSLGPFTFKPGQIQEIEVAFCIGLATPDMPGSAVNNLVSGINYLQEEISNGNIISPNNQLGFNHKAVNESQIRVYPNPASTTITIELPASLASATSAASASTSASAIAKYMVYNLLGTIIMQGNITDVPRQTINIANLPDGFYLLKVSNGGGSSVVKFIKY